MVCYADSAAYASASEQVFGQDILASAINNSVIKIMVFGLAYFVWLIIIVRYSI